MLLRKKEELSRVPECGGAGYNKLDEGCCQPGGEGRESERRRRAKRRAPRGASILAAHSHCCASGSLILIISSVHFLFTVIKE